jgi:hypothetical protein
VPPLDGIQVKHIFGTTLKDNFVEKAVYEDFLPCALKLRAFVPAPEPVVVGTSLEKVQEAVDLYGKREISAEKLVVLL